MYVLRTKIDNIINELKGTELFTVLYCARMGCQGGLRIGGVYNGKIIFHLRGKELE